MLLSDGVPEARSQAGELYGFERLSSLTRIPAQEIAEAAQRFGQEDDITVLTLAFAADLPETVTTCRRDVSSGPGIYRHKLCSALGAVLAQQQLGRLHRWQARLTEACLSAVVEDDVGGEFLLTISRDAPNGPSCDLFRADRLPVFRNDVPLDRHEAERASECEHSRTARSMGWTEVADRDAESVFEDAVAVGELLADAGGGLPGEPWVGHRVVADEMPGRGDGTGDLRALANISADEEEAGADIELGEHVEKALSDHVIGAVVECESDFVWVVAGYQGFAEQLGFR